MIREIILTTCFGIVLMVFVILFIKSLKNMIKLEKEIEKERDKNDMV